MKNFIKNSLIFIAGAGVGAGITYFSIKTKYGNIADEVVCLIRNSQKN